MRKAILSLFNRIKDPTPAFSDSILVSFCNLDRATPKPSGLLQLDLKKEKGCWIKINRNGKPISSCTGIASHNDEIFHVFKSGDMYHIAILDIGDLRLKAVHQLNQVKDVHSIFVNDSGIYVVSTGTDEIALFPLRNGKLGKKEVVWSPSRQGVDTHHLNSIWIEGNGDLICSGFGPKKTERWSSAENGYIYNITTQTVIEKPVVHPHSVVISSGNLYYCESSFSSLNTQNRERVFRFQGYTRGICFLDSNVVVVGSSQGRKISKSTGLINNIADPGVKTGRCEIHICDLKTKQILKSIDLSAYNREIYDLYYPAGVIFGNGHLP